MANFNEEAASAYDWKTGGVYVIEETDPVQGGPEGISNRQGRELAVRTRNLHERLEQAQVDTTTKVEAALRSSKEYTDTREVSILAAADTKDAETLRTAKDYADAIVAALIDGSPEFLDTFLEFAKAIGNDPNFSATIMELIGQKLDAANYTAADVLAKLLAVDGYGSKLVSDFIADRKDASALGFWSGTQSEYNAIAIKDPRTIYIVL